METLTSCTLVPSGLTTDLSARSNKIEVGSKAVMPTTLEVLVFKILMVVPRSTNVFRKVKPCI